MNPLQRFFVAAGIVCLPLWLPACDVCGCAVSANSFGLLPLVPRHFAGLRWQHTLQIGGGVKWPTGRSDFRDAENEVPPPALQPGTGSNDVPMVFPNVKKQICCAAPARCNKFNRSNTFKLSFTMKKVQSLLLFAAILVFVFITACDGSKDSVDSAAPTLVIEDPTDGESISGEVHIHGKVTDESLHEMEIVVTKDSDGSELFKAKPVVHDKAEYDFDEHFTPAGLSGETAVTLTITAEDHGGNETTKLVHFKVKP